jgi:Flp pilus assembly pilin Flp
MAGHARLALHDREPVMLQSSRSPADTWNMTRAYLHLYSALIGARDREAGQTMAEYAVVLAVIVVAIVATLILLGGGIKSTLSSVTTRL